MPYWVREQENDKQRSHGEFATREDAERKVAELVELDPRYADVLTILDTEPPAPPVEEY